MKLSEILSNRTTRKDFGLKGVVKTDIGKPELLEDRIRALVGSISEDTLK